MSLTPPRKSSHNPFDSPTRLPAAIGINLAGRFANVSLASTDAGSQTLANGKKNYADK